jgi:hypothetical protein
LVRSALHSIKGIEGVYNRYDYADEKRKRSPDPLLPNVI